MALVVGTNCGFLTTAPSTDPSGNQSYFNADGDNRGLAGRFTTPVGGASAWHITEIGWWCNTASEAANFQVGIYSHNSGTNTASSLIGSSGDVAKGTIAGWKKSAVDITLDGSTVYWIAFQLDNVSTTTYTDDQNLGGDEKYSVCGTITELPENWTNTASRDDTLAIYAVYEEAGSTSTRTQVNIGDTWKEAPSLKVNVGDTWKEVAGEQLNVGDTWKEIW